MDPQLDKDRVRSSFDGAASRYDELAVLQKEVGSRLFERLNYIKIQPQRVLDLGAGTGEYTAALHKRFKTQTVALDISEGMLRIAKKRRGWFSRFMLLCADAEKPPLSDNSVDLIFSNLCLQWVDDLDACFTELHRILAPGGLLLFSTFGPDTLKELKTSWARVDEGVHVHPFVDMHHVGDALVGAGFQDPVMDMEMLTLTYPDVRSLMGDLKGIGAHNASTQRQKSLSGRHKYKKMAEAYESYRNEGVLPATYEVVYGHAWGRHIPQPGQHAIPMQSLRRYKKV